MSELLKNNLDVIDAIEAVLKRFTAMSEEIASLKMTNSQLLIGNACKSQTTIRLKQKLEEKEK